MNLSRIADTRCKAGVCDSLPFPPHEGQNLSHSQTSGRLRIHLKVGCPVILLNCSLTQ